MTIYHRYRRHKVIFRQCNCCLQSKNSRNYDLNQFLKGLFLGSLLNFLAIYLRRIVHIHLRLFTEIQCFVWSPFDSIVSLVTRALTQFHLHLSRIIINACRSKGHVFRKAQFRKSIAL